MATSTTKRLQRDAQVSVKAAEAESKRLRTRVKELEEEVASETNLRISAQQGYIDRLREPCVNCGAKWHTRKIAYDPDRDPKLHPELARTWQARLQGLVWRARQSFA